MLDADLAGCLCVGCLPCCCSNVTIELSTPNNNKPVKVLCPGGDYVVKVRAAQSLTRSGVRPGCLRVRQCCNCSGSYTSSGSQSAGLTKTQQRLHMQSTCVCRSRCWRLTVCPAGDIPFSSPGAGDSINGHTAGCHKSVVVRVKCWGWSLDVFLFRLTLPKAAAQHSNPHPSQHMCLCLVAVYCCSYLQLEPDCHTPEAPRAQRDHHPEGGMCCIRWVVVESAVVLHIVGVC